MIRFRCPRCNSTLGVPPDQGGRKVACGKCRQWLRVPVPSGRQSIPAQLVFAPAPARPPAQPARPAVAAPRTPRWPACVAAAVLIGVSAFFFVLTEKADLPGDGQAKARVHAQGERAQAAGEPDPSPPPGKEPDVPAPPTERPDPPAPPAGKPAAAVEQLQMPREEAPPEVEPPPAQKDDTPPKIDKDVPPPEPKKPAPVVKPRPPVKPKQPDGKTETAGPRPLHLRTVEEIQRALAEINAAPAKELSGAAAERDAALRRLKSYRYLVGVPYANVVLDDELNRSAAAAARVCEKLGRLDHNPPNPGLPEEEYNLGRASARKSNLHFSSRPGASLSGSIDSYMDDSDNANIDRVGHRRWCLFPLLRKVGLGRSGTFFAMYAHDRSQPAAPPFDFVAFPAPGPMPLQYFAPHYAWSISVNPKKYAPPDEAIEVSVYPAAASGDKSGPALPLNYKRVDRAFMGIPNCIIFRPDKSAVAVGKRYLVEVKGLRLATRRPAPPLRYPVEFVRLGTSPRIGYRFGPRMQFGLAVGDDPENGRRLTYADDGATSKRPRVYPAGWRPPAHTSTLRRGGLNMRFPMVMILFLVPGGLCRAVEPRPGADDEDASVVKAMLARFETPNLESATRRKLIEALGALGGKAKEAVPTLVKYLETELGRRVKARERYLAPSGESTVHAAVEALGKIGAPAQPAAKVLLTILKDIDGFTTSGGFESTTPKYRTAAAVALGRLGAKGPLIELRVSAAADPDENVRKAAAEAVKAIQAAPAAPPPVKGAATVLGRLTYDGKPLTAGTVTLTPAAGGKGVSGAVQKDGTFSVAGANPGTVKVTITLPLGSGLAIPAAYTEPRTTPLSLEIKAGENSLDISLTSKSPPAQKDGTVSGKVTYKGKPLPAGTVKFHSAKGKAVSATIQEDGTYRAKGVPAGDARLTVSRGVGKGQPRGFPIPLQYASPATSALRCNVLPGEQTLNIELR